MKKIVGNYLKFWENLAKMGKHFEEKNRLKSSKIQQKLVTNFLKREKIVIKLIRNSEK